MSLFFTASAYSQCADSANIYEFSYSGKIYEVVKEKKTWDAAASCAVERGGYLVEINDQDEQDAVYDAIINGAGVSSTYVVVGNGGAIAYVWIGATDKSREGIWLWDGDGDDEGTVFWTGQGANGSDNGEAADGAFYNWGGKSKGKAQEPDNWSGQDHAAIGLAGWPSGSTALGVAGEWNDIVGFSSLYYVIEYDSLSSGINNYETPVFKIYPNPTTGILNVRGYGIESIEIIDFTGRSLKYFGTLTIDLSDHPKGIYFVKIRTIESVITRKIIVE